MRYFLKLVVSAGAVFVFTMSSAKAVFLDGEGYYAIRPQTVQNPGFSDDRGLLQATQQSFSLLGEIKSGDRIGFKFNMRLFDERESYLGDTPQPQDCSELEDDPNSETSRKRNKNTGSTSSCSGRHQDTNDPAYAPYFPRFTEAYIEYGFEYCLLQAGRRSRDWGLGIFLDSGRKPFDSSASVYDGVSCTVNALKAEKLSLSFGVDRLAETGASIDVGLPESDTTSTTYGPSKNTDDLDQITASITLDDRKADPNAWFARTIGVYFANVIGTSKFGDEAQKLKTDLKFGDLFTGFYVGNVSIEHEVLFRLGKTPDPSWSRYGSASNSEEDDPFRTNVGTIGFAGALRWKLGVTGSYVGPEEYNKGNYSYHEIFTQYGYAPGERSGYYDESERREMGHKKARALAFNRNYKPGLLIFNGGASADDLRVDGIFDANRVMNASFINVGYKYFSVQYGTFETKFLTAQLNSGIPGEIKSKTYQQELSDEAEGERSADRPIGYSGKNLGYEIDLMYSRNYGKNVNLGLATAVGIPGAAWRTNKDDSPVMSYLLMGQAGFKF